MIFITKVTWLHVGKLSGLLGSRDSVLTGLRMCDEVISLQLPSLKMKGGKHNYWTQTSSKYFT